VTDATLIGAHVLSPGEAREKRGLDPDTAPELPALPAPQEVTSNA
jgi:hypothetical protein